jgi:membrane fusion protein, multidrug efflux system
MAEDVAELESRPAEPQRNEGTDLAPTRENDRQPQYGEGKPKRRGRREVDKIPASPPRWPFILVGFIVRFSLLRSSTSFFGRARMCAPRMPM